MPRFTITAIGNRVGEEVERALSDIQLNTVNPVKQGKFGNLITLTFVIDFTEEEVIDMRKQVMSEIARKDPNLACTYDSKDWMSAYIFDRLAFKTRS